MRCLGEYDACTGREKVELELDGDVIHTSIDRDETRYVITYGLSGEMRRES